MFVQAIEDVARFTTPIHTIERSYGSTTVRPGAATMFFVNEEGVAITCNHVAGLIPFSDNLSKKFTEFKRIKDSLQKGGNYNKKVKELIQQYGFDTNPLCELLVQLNCVQSFDGVEVTPHPKYDLAIIRLINPKNFYYNSYARFIRTGTEIKQGSYLCRLGFPFPEFQNFRYNASSDSIQWTNTGVTATPRFPIEGMVTRHLGDENGIFGIEMSTPGLKGQSGGPLFDSQGVIHGMQFATNHLHLGFDMKNKELIANGEKIKIGNYQPFLHVGLCIHAEVIKNFLREKAIRFYEG
ncbi:MAG TPA: trypsin-like peptidase domain-containing protein [Flavisolibacter sp.]|nr:trypsin-like peptidase domain-containing protein [Flavisolibacter sp.]